MIRQEAPTLPRHLPTSLGPLVDYLDTLDHRASVGRLHELLTQCAVTLDELSDYLIFDEHRYRRNLICEGKWYELLLICWRSGQRSPIHNHAGSTCGLKIMTGVATETVFAFTPSGQIKAISSHELRRGQVTASQDEDTHQVSNLEAPGTDLATLHIYSPPLREMEMYSITGEPVGVYRPINFEFAHGGGI